MVTPIAGGVTHEASMSFDLTKIYEKHKSQFPGKEKELENVLKSAFAAGVKEAKTNYQIAKFLKRL